MSVEKADGEVILTRCHPVECRQTLETAQARWRETPKLPYPAVISSRKGSRKEDDDFSCLAEVNEVESMSVLTTHVSHPWPGTGSNGLRDNHEIAENKILWYDRTPPKLARTGDGSSAPLEGTPGQEEPASAHYLSLTGGYHHATPTLGLPFTGNARSEIKQEEYHVSPSRTNGEPPSNGGSAYPMVLKGSHHHHHQQHHSHQHPHPHQQPHLSSPQAGGGGSGNATTGAINDSGPGTPNSNSSSGGGAGSGRAAKDGNTTATTATSGSSPAPPLSPSEESSGQGTVFTVLTPVPTGPVSHSAGGGTQGAYTPLPSIGQFSSKPPCAVKALALVLLGWRNCADGLPFHSTHPGLHSFQNIPFKY
ncbi:hypothetical protein PoB_000130800 [Plakobranchus ocellatus]|uniref:Uncharacterized protein n=1 Tax=Plakobranchus ocellatus TaxID=259542 RepID=A0AAV3XX24_9GAST|nr:hypothetical protein PoB_000130800 [Plakobranchus ocellatus]